jgi:hypothetical protein
MNANSFTLLACLSLLQWSHVLANDEKDEPQWKQFRQLSSAEWKEVFHDSCSAGWSDRWTLDGLKATVIHSDRGMDFRAGPNRKEDASHAVMWTKDSFQGDIHLVTRTGIDGGAMADNTTLKHA